MFAFRFWSYFFAVLESMKSNHLLIQQYSTGSTCNKKRLGGLMKSIYTRCLIYQAARVQGEPKFFFIPVEEKKSDLMEITRRRDSYRSCTHATYSCNSSPQLRELLQYYKCKFWEMWQSMVLWSSCTWSDIIFRWLPFYYVVCEYIAIFSWGKEGGDIE